MADPLQKQIFELWARYIGLYALSLTDLQIDPAERKRLDAIGAQLKKLVAQQKQKTIDEVVGKLKVDPAQEKAFREKLQALPADSQAAAADVLEVMYASPRPADEVEQISKTMAALPAGQDMAVGKALNELGVYLPNLQPDSPGAEDASARIKKIHMSGQYDRDSIQGDYIRDIISQAKDQNFKVVLQVHRGIDVADLKKRIAGDMAGIKDVKELEKYVEVLEADKNDYIWAEDNKWLSADGKTVRTPPKVSEGAFDALAAFTGALSLKPGDPGYASEGHHTAGKSAADPGSDEFPAGVVDDFALQGAVAGGDEHLKAEALAKATGKKLVTTRTYNEGGNMLAGTLPNGQPYGVIGRDGLLLSTFHLQEQYKADPAKVPEFAPANIDKRIKSMTFDATEIKQTIQRLKAAKQIPAGSTKADQEQAAKVFLAKLDLVKDIFAEDSEVPREQLVFVSQPDFHVDMHMRPLGPGQVMVNDFDANIKLIDEALKKAKPGSWEESELKSMRAHAEQAKKVLGPVMEQIAKQCKDGGLEVVPAPGVMEGQFESVKITRTTTVDVFGRSFEVGRYLGVTSDKEMSRKELGKALLKKAGSRADDLRDFFDVALDELYTRHVNFMNAIPGTTDGTNEQFYMTNSSSLGPLREAYEAYMKQRGVEKVLWVGDDGGGDSQRSRSEESLQLMGGLDCRENH